ncbi:hypothetical protein FIBSPDRAFT_973594 [Athelia psychrophila]|uniref:Uncharacterized protein n=1 Tax=Athelia psychrophila TaxID=1759441 RepID=A0A166G3I4_9AGAM|nr:hypothetical protein FIBSPDRAFT_973594 [Fibularhizoctonia sp. CBS 109695]
MLFPCPSGSFWRTRVWYKAAIEVEADEAIEAKCRPRVHTGIRMNDGLEIVNRQKKSRTDMHMPMFKAHRMSKPHVFNPGVPTWDIYWCPIHSEQRKAPLPYQPQPRLPLSLTMRLWTCVLTMFAYVSITVHRNIPAQEMEDSSCHSSACVKTREESGLRSSGGGGWHPTLVIVVAVWSRYPMRTV